MLQCDAGLVASGGVSWREPCLGHVFTQCRPGVASFLVKCTQPICIPAASLPGAQRLWRACSAAGGQGSVWARAAVHAFGWALPGWQGCLHGESGLPRLWLSVTSSPLLLLSQPLLEKRFLNHFFFLDSLIHICNDF